MLGRTDWGSIRSFGNRMPEPKPEPYWPVASGGDSHANRPNAVRQKFIQNKLRGITSQPIAATKILDATYWLASFAG